MQKFFAECVWVQSQSISFWQESKFSCCFNNDPPALESSTASEVVAEHLNALHTARKAYIASESCEKLRRAMKHRARPATSLVYQTGDVGFYKRNESSKWKGPGIVIGRDNHHVFVKHGGTYVRVNPCHLRRSTDTIFERNNEESQMINYKKQSNSDLTTVNCELKDAQDDFDLSVTEHPSVGGPDIQQHEASSNDDEISRENESDRSTIVPSDDQTHKLEAEDINPTLTAGRLTTTGNKIEYKLPNSSTWHAALVLGRAGKATGKNKYWINIKNLSDNTLQSLNIEELTSWKNMNEEVLLNSATSDAVEVLSAKRKSWTTGKNTMFILKLQTKDHNVFLSGGELQKKWEKIDQLLKQDL